MTIETPSESATQIRAPSKPMAVGNWPRLLATVVTAPGAFEGSMA